MEWTDPRYAALVEEIEGQVSELPPRPPQQMASRNPVKRLFPQPQPRPSRPLGGHRFFVVRDGDGGDRVINCDS